MLSAQRSMNIDYFENEWPYEYDMFLNLAPEDLLEFVMSADSVDFFYNVSDWITENSTKIESPSWNEKEAEELWFKWTQEKEENLASYLDKDTKIDDNASLDFSYNTDYAKDQFNKMVQNHQSFLLYVADNFSNGEKAAYDFKDKKWSLRMAVQEFFHANYSGEK